MSIQERLKLVVAVSGFGHAELARAVGCVPNTIYYYTSGRRKPTYLAIQKIAEKCEVNLEWLTTGTKPPILRYHRFTELISSEGLSIKDFAAKLDKPESFINAIISNDIYPSDDFLERARKIFNKPRDYYLPGNKCNVAEERARYFDQEYPDIVDMVSSDDEFKSDLDMLMSRWRRIKSLERRQQ